MIELWFSIIGVGLVLAGFVWCIGVVEIAVSKTINWLRRMT